MYLDVEFPEEMKKWNDNKKKKILECLTKETLEAIIFTSRSIANCIRRLLDSGQKYVLTRRFSTDNIERSMDRFVIIEEAITTHRLLTV